MRVIASLMSSTRSASLRLDIGQGLADALRDAFHADTLQALRRQNVYFPAEQPLQIFRKAEKVVVGWPLEVDQKIEIALSVLSAAGIRTEQRNSANRVLLKKLVIPAQRAQDALPGEIVFRALVHCRVRPWCTNVSFRQLRTGRRKVLGMPLGDSCSAAKSALFDHLVSDGKHAWGNCEAERPGGLE